DYYCYSTDINGNGFF
nr:immunoglobulin light chain junction region [Macaca mulatta]MOW28999.1 immunoglobulin light chain junction region [Macaca mulatta]MOW30794.1 immunoglobulin light chain junction region [Macaca mulatta]